MKKINYSKALMAGIVFLSAIIFDLFVLGGTGATGTVLASVAVTGTQTSEAIETAAPDHLERDISKIVTDMKKDEFPLDTIIRNIRKAEEAKSEKVEYEEVQYRGRESVTSAAFTQATLASDENAQLSVSNVKIWGVDDQVGVVGQNGWDSKRLTLHVVAVDRAGGTINVTAINGQSEANNQWVPTIASGSTLKRLGNAKNELASTTDIIAMVPGQDFNYCSIKMAFLEESVVRSLRKAYTGYGYSEQYIQEIYNFRSSCAATHWSGRKGKIINPVNDELIYSSDGIIPRVTQSTDFGSGAGAMDISKADITKVLKETFSGNAGSAERFAFLGADVAEALENVTFDKNVQALESDIVHGVKVNKLVSRFGTLNLVYDKMLDELGYAKEAYILDLAHIYKHDLEPMQMKDLDPDKAGTRRVKNAKRILENTCLTVRYTAAHRRWKAA
jgi:hypothetical protein